MKEVEVKVITNKYNLLREDYTSLKLAQMVGEKQHPPVVVDSSKDINILDRPYDVNSFGYMELVKENQELKELLKRQEEGHRQES